MSKPPIPQLTTDYLKTIGISDKPGDTSFSDALAKGQLSNLSVKPPVIDGVAVSDGDWAAIQQQILARAREVAADSYSKDNLSINQKQNIKLQEKQLETQVLGQEISNDTNVVALKNATLDYEANHRDFATALATAGVNPDDVLKLAADGKLQQILVANGYNNKDTEKFLDNIGKLANIRQGALTADVTQIQRDALEGLSEVGGKGVQNALLQYKLQAAQIGQTNAQTGNLQVNTESTELDVGAKKQTYAALKKKADAGTLTGAEAGYWQAMNAAENTEVNTEQAKVNLASSEMDLKLQQINFPLSVLMAQLSNALFIPIAGKILGNIQANNGQTSGASYKTSLPSGVPDLTPPIADPVSLSGGPQVKPGGSRVQVPGGHP